MFVNLIMILLGYWEPSCFKQTDNNRCNYAEDGVVVVQVQPRDSCMLKCPLVPARQSAARDKHANWSFFVID